MSEEATIAERINAAEVRQALTDSLYKDDEIVDGKPPDGAILVKGIISQFGFNPERLEAQREKVKGWLQALPEAFQQARGGGWSFLNACNDANGEQWGEHKDMEALFCLGIALGLAEWQPREREMWSAFPGGMPYVVVMEPQDGS